MTQLVPNAPKTSTSVNQPVLDTHMHNTTNTTTTTNPPTNRPQSNQHPPQPSYNTLTRRGSLASLIVTSPTGGVKRNHLAAFAPLVEAAGIVGDAQDNTHDAHPHAGGTTGTTIGTTMTVDHVDQPMTQGTLLQVHDTPTQKHAQQHAQEMTSLFLFSPYRWTTRGGSTAAKAQHSTARHVDQAPAAAATSRVGQTCSVDSSRWHE